MLPCLLSAVAVWFPLTLQRSAMYISFAMFKPYRN